LNNAKKEKIDLLPNNRTSQTEVFTPAFKGPPLEENLDGHLELGMQAIVSKKSHAWETMVV
jgi:hypothetical protein